jgi:hypothetical protein
MNVAYADTEGTQDIQKAIAKNTESIEIEALAQKLTLGKAPTKSVKADSVTVIGDSVPLGAQLYGNMKNRLAATKGVSWCRVDNRGSRRLAAAVDLAKQLMRQGKLGSIVVFATSTNGSFGYAEAKAARKAMGKSRYVIFVTGYNRGYTYPDTSNAAMKRLAGEDKKVFVADWNKLIRTKGGKGISDGRCHLNGTGARWYVDEIIKTIRKVRLTKATIAKDSFNKWLSPLIASPGITLAVGAKVQTPINALSIAAKAGRTYKWSSSNSKVVKVNSKGKLTALSVGKATITLKELKPTARTKKVVVTVVGKKKVASSISVSTKRINSWGYQLKVSSKKGVVTGVPVFKSLNPKIASVNNAGYVLGKKAGTTKIKVSYGSKTKYITIKVK